MKNEEVLKTIDGLSDDSISSMLEVLDSLGISEISNGWSIPGRFGKTIEVIDISQKSYFFGLSEYGFVEIVRSESPSGKIIYLPIDD